MEKILILEHKARSERKECFLSCLLTLTTEKDAVGDRPSEMYV